MDGEQLAEPGTREESEPEPAAVPSMEEADDLDADPDEEERPAPGYIYEPL